MKKLLIAIPLFALMSCGSKPEGETKEEGFTAKSEYYSKFKFSGSSSLEGSVVMGQSIDEVKKNHSGDEMTDSDVDYLTFDRKLGSSEDDVASFYYGFESETGKLNYATIDIYAGTNADEEELYNDLIASFNERFGSSIDYNGKSYQGKEWSAKVGSTQTTITVERDTDQDYSWITITFNSEEY